VDPLFVEVKLVLRGGTDVSSDDDELSVLCPGGAYPLVVLLYPVDEDRDKVPDSPDEVPTLLLPLLIPVDEGPTLLNPVDDEIPVLLSSVDDKSPVLLSSVDDESPERLLLSPVDDEPLLDPGEDEGATLLLESNGDDFAVLLEPESDGPVTLFWELVTVLRGIVLVKPLWELVRLLCVDALVRLLRELESVLCVFEPDGLLLVVREVTVL
jgi:hypothetical protein